MIRRFFNSRLNRLTYGSIAVMAVFFFALMGRGGVAGSFGPHASFQYYFFIISESFGYVILGGIYFIAAFLVAIVTLSLLRNFINLARGRKEMPTMLGARSVRGVLLNAAKRIGTTVTILAPAFFFTILLSFTLDSLNAIGKLRLIDITLINFERATLGNYGFMIFSAAPYPGFFIRFIILSFEGMSGILIAAAIVIACVRSNVLREFAAAFCFSMLLMVPLWLMFPALSPHDRFIDNAYHLPMSADMTLAVANFHPVSPIADFLAKIRAGKRGLVDLPTSTLPSAHTAWAVLVGFFLFRIRKWIGWIALPFLVGSTLGTVILAQHYFLDPIIGVFVAGFAIWVTDKLTKRDRRAES